MSKETALEAKYRADLLKTGLEIIRNPIVELIGGFVVVEMLQDRGMIGDDSPSIGRFHLTPTQGDLLETAIIGLIAIQQISPMMPYIAAAGSDVMGTVKAVAPSMIPMLAGL